MFFVPATDVPHWSAEEHVSEWPLSKRTWCVNGTWREGADHNEPSKTHKSWKPKKTEKSWLCLPVMQYESWLLCSKGNWRNMTFCSMCVLLSISSWPLDFHPLNFQNVWIARHFLDCNNQLSKLLLRRESRLGNKIVAKNCHHFFKKGNFFSLILFLGWDSWGLD